MENYEYLAGSTRPPFTLAEIILFLTVIYLFMGNGGIWQALLAVLLLICWFALMAGKLWPPPKFNLPVSSLVRESIPKEKKFKANFVWSIKYKVGLWWHFFPVKKYSLTHNRVLEEKILTKDDFRTPSPLQDLDLALVHGRGYLWRLYLLSITPLGYINGENPISFRILNKLKIACGGTYLACKIALEHQIGMNLGGGFHHAFACHEEGFCHLNDMAIAIRKLQTERFIDRAMIIDCDVHQGNGTAAIFEGDETVFTFSIHQENLYPYPKQYSNYDISIHSSQRVDDKKYLEELKVLPGLIQKHRPDLIIYLAGADPFQEDRLGGFLLTKQGLMERDTYVLGKCFEIGIPTAIVLGGGYTRNIDDIVEIHLNTIRVVHKLLKVDV